MKVFVRIPAAHLYGPVWATPDHTFSMGIDSPTARVLCAAECGRTLGGEKVAMVPIAQSPSEPRHTGWVNGLAVLMHVTCLPPQPDPAWGEVIRLSQELAQTATADPARTGEANRLTALLQEAVTRARLISGIPDPEETP